MDRNRLTRILVDATEHSDMVKSSKHAAAILYKGQILAIGNNKRKTHPLMSKFVNGPKIFLHAEVDAIIRTVNNHGIEILSDCTLYVLRTTKSGRIAGSEPCNICKRIISSFNIPQTFWS
jgi:tRNA(Arg) A34 adenosine deaminase TadA